MPIIITMGLIVLYLAGVAYYNYKHPPEPIN